METGFKDPIAIKKGKSMKSPWNFDAPHYDERTSCYVNAGSHYGVGHAQKVGTKKHNPTYAVPVGRVKTLEVDEKPIRNLRLEIEE